MTLSDFLYRHEEERNLNGKKIMVYKCNNKNEYTYELTELGIVYYKLFLVATTYCGYCKYMRMHFAYVEHFEKVIDTKEVKFLR